MKVNDNQAADLRGAQAAFLTIWGMDCRQCSRAIRQKLLSLDGVLLAEVSLEQRLATAAYDPERITPTELVCAVDSTVLDGRHEYTAELISVVPAALALDL